MDPTIRQKNALKAIFIKKGPSIELTTEKTGVRLKDHSKEECSKKNGTDQILLLLISCDDRNPKIG